MKTRASISSRISRHALCCSVAALSLCTLLVACDKVPINGDLDGMWQLMSIQTPDTIRDMKTARVYTCFQLHLTQWNDNPKGRTFYSHFTHTADSLIFFDIAHASKHAVDDNEDEWVTPGQMAEGLFDCWGIHSVNPRFRVLKLDSQTLELQQADTILLYRKF